jgi:hypothetical protein
MRALLLILGAVFAVAAVLLLAEGVPSGLLVAGFVVVAMAFVLLAAQHVRQVVTTEWCSSTFSVTWTHNLAGAGHPDRPALASGAKLKSRVA